jgi:hypothetical protein
MTQEKPENLDQLRSVLTRAHYRRLRFYWVNRPHAPNQGTVIDLDLYRLGLIVPSKHGHSHYHTTDLGVAVLVAQSEAERARRSPHHELAGRVAQWLRDKGRMTWEGVEFRVQSQDVSKTARAMAIDTSRGRDILYACPRPDVFSVVPTMTEARIEPEVHEVKVSRADFLADIAKPEKRLAYALIAQRVFYVLPEGLVNADEVPEGCGLVYESKPGEFRVEKRAKKRPVKLEPTHFMNMVVKPGVLPDSLA